MSDPFADVKRRHPDIEQDPLPGTDDLAVESADEPTSRRGQPSIRQAFCPYCHKDKPTGVVRASDGTEVLRTHNKVLATGRRIRCNGSGTEAPL
jgi:hypothetical protein